MTATDDLISLQSEYSTWSVPENFWEPPLQEKLSDVEGLNFKELQHKIPDLRDMPDPLKEFDPHEDDFFVLDEAEEIDLPKGYGRD